MDIWPSIVLIFMLIFVNAFFAMSEIAIISINSQKMKRLAEGGNKAAKRLLAITDSPSDFLATIQVGVTLSGFLNSAVAADNFAGPVAGLLSFLPLPAAVLRSVVLVVITIIISYFTLILGELVPKRCGPEGGGHRVGYVPRMQAVRAFSGLLHQPCAEAVRHWGGK